MVITLMALGDSTAVTFSYLANSKLDHLHLWYQGPLMLEQLLSSFETLKDSGLKYSLSQVGINILL